MAEQADNHAELPMASRTRTQIATPTSFSAVIAAWTQEWLALPQICVTTAKFLALSCELVGDLRPDVEAMVKRLTGQNGLVYAEAISFKLAESMPQPVAQAELKQLCKKALDQGCSLLELVAGEYPDFDWGSVATP